MTRLVSRHWADEFTMELRARGVPGKEIGDALTHVESFCADAGEAASEAFGPPREYAATLQPQSAPGAFADWRPGIPQLVLLVLQVAAFAPLASAVPALLDGRQVEITWSAGAVALVAGALLLVVLHRIDAALRWIMRAGFLRVAGVATIPTVAMVGAGLGAHLLAPGALVALPPAPVVVVTGVLVLAPALVETFRPRTESDVDPLVRPFDDEARVQRSAERLDRYASWVVPAFAAVAVAMTLALEALASA